jgi:signal transduction histidine kinase
MKEALRFRYFLWLAALLLSFYAAFALVLWGFNLHEMHEAGHDPVEEREEFFILLGLGAGLLPIMLALAWDMSRRMVRPLQGIAATARRISNGHLEERIQPTRTDNEIAVVVSTLNLALDRYQEAVNRLQRFSSDASHQLRTPLTAMRSAGEIALQRDRTPEEYRDAIGTMLEDAQHLGHVVEQLLLLSRLDQGRLTESFQLMDLGDVARQTCAQFEPVALDRNIALRTESSGRAPIRGNEALIQQALANLLDNALRHTPAGGRVLVQVTSSRHAWIELRVADSGPGIPPAFRHRLFERFAKPAGSSSGSGLGLAIVAEIVKGHGGSITLSENSDPGACFLIRLPAAG